MEKMNQTEYTASQLLIKIIAQECKLVGFGSITKGALSTFYLALDSYFTQLLQSLKQVSSHCGRTRINLIDIRLVFEYFNITITSLVQSSTQPVLTRRDINTNLHFFVNRELFTIEDRHLKVGENAKSQPFYNYTTWPFSYIPQHIPRNLPPFPSPHTYSSITAFPKPPMNPIEAQTRAVQQKRTVEDNLGSMMYSYLKNADEEARDRATLIEFSVKR